MQERLQKLLARAGVLSRRASELAITQGRVSVNGEIVTTLGSKADPATDEIRFDGKPLRRPPELAYFLLNKPKGVVTTRRDPEGRATVMDLVPPVPGLFPVGRLDVGTEGVLLLTNDGAFAERVSHPRYEVPRVYHAKVHGIPSAQALERACRGVMVDGERLAADKVRFLERDKNAWLEITLHEGKHHEVKRLFEALGHPVAKLQRVAIGTLTAKGLAVGGFRSLTPQELRRLAPTRRAK